MMNKNYIITQLSSKKEFRLDVSSLSLLGMHFNGVNIKIDTGCGYSTIPIQRLNITASLAKQLKLRDVNALISKLQNHIKMGCSLEQAKKLEYSKAYKLSYGIESGGKNHKQINFLKSTDLMNEEAISFRHKISNILLGNSLCELEIPDTYMYINYDRRGNILLGMDILENMDIHISGSAKTKKTTFLACPKDQINDEYLQELENTFHISSDINAMFIRQKMK